MNKELINNLKKEGYKEIYKWKDKPNKIYEKHYHNTEKKLIIISGSIKISINDKEKLYVKGDLIYIGKKVKHSAIVGPNGCNYLVGEK